MHPRSLVISIECSLYRNGQDLLDIQYLRLSPSWPRGARSAARSRSTPEAAAAAHKIQSVQHVLSNTTQLGNTIFFVILNRIYWILLFLLYYFCHTFAKKGAKTGKYDYNLTLILWNTECPVCSVQKKSVSQHGGYVILDRIYWILLLSYLYYSIINV